MFSKNFVGFLKEIIFDQPPTCEACFLQSPCGCSAPGKDDQCESCAYLEACLSRVKRQEMNRDRNRK